MNALRKTTIFALIIIATSQVFGQDTNTEKQAVLKVMKTYKDALQNLTTEGTFVHKRLGSF